jgi:hypothetical protein
MVEGVKNDDKWRMVEDEFLTVAKRFTVHLHAAEYKRQQKMVKSRNAETINTISRPVAGKMPDHTKRRMEAAARVKAQRAALEDVIIKKAEDDDDSDDGDGLPYFGTTLHGLMDSPRKKAASLAKSGTIAATTRAVAGFKQPAAHSKSDRMHNSPQSKVAEARPPNDAETESSEDDDDLDAPIPAPRFGNAVREPIDTSAFRATSSNNITKSTMSFPVAKPSSLSTSLSTTKSSSFSMDEPEQPREQLSPEFRSRSSRLEQARRRKAKLEKEQKDKKLLDVIPTFL